MILKNENYNVELKFDENFVLDSADNIYKYEDVVNLQDYRNGDFCNALAVRAKGSNDEYCIVSIGSGYSTDVSCATLEGQELTVLQDSLIYTYDLRKRKIVRYSDIECIGCNYEIRAARGGFIIIGELEIIMLDRNFNKLWFFIGSDNFVSQKRTKGVFLKDDRICVYDWGNNYYEIDYSGNRLA